jgi:ribosomal protein L14E/L6E/L27E
MAMITVGNICIKNRGRDGGRRCVVMSLVDANYVEVLCASRKKRRRCSIHHLEPIGQSIELKGSDEEIRKLLGA